MTKINAILSTPTSQMTSREGDMIVLPGQQGEVGFLLNHMPMIIELQPGNIKIYDGSDIIEEIPVAGGIAYIKSDRVEIFAPVLLTKA